MRWLVWVFTFVSVVTMADEARIREAITGINPMIQIKSVTAVVETPFFEVNLMSGERVYTDKSGVYFVAGDLYRDWDRWRKKSDRNQSPSGSSSDLGRS